MTEREPRRLLDDRGTAATIVLFPLFAVLTFAFAQTVFWQQDRQLATAAADRASVAVALYDSDPGAARAEAAARLQRAGMRNVSVSISKGPNQTVVVITGTAPGILVGTSSTVTARSVTPTERFRAP